MGSLRNPVGPLPSSIYWRRRAVALCLLVLLAALAVWAVTSGGGSGNGEGKGGANGDGPAESITPGPSSSGPAISERPGGRDESGGGADDGGGSTGGTGGVDGGTDAGGGGAGEGDPSGGTGGSGGSGGDGGSGTGGWNGIPVGTSLPRCGPGSVELKLHSAENTYAPGEKPEIELTAENSSGHDCKVDFGAAAAVLTITPAEGDDPVWVSDDCLRENRDILLRVPAGGTARYTFEWDREPSAPECATPSDRSVDAGTYLVEAEADGLETAKTSFVLAKD